MRWVYCSLPCEYSPRLPRHAKARNPTFHSQFVFFKLNIIAKKANDSKARLDCKRSSLQLENLWILLSSWQYFTYISLNSFPLLRSDWSSQSITPVPEHIWGTIADESFAGGLSSPARWFVVPFSCSCEQGTGVLCSANRSRHRPRKVFISSSLLTKFFIIRKKYQIRDPAGSQDSIKYQYGGQNTI